jgi:ABC-type ATPase involved in cell division
MANGNGKKALARKAQRALRRAAEAPARAVGAAAAGLIGGHGRARKATLKKLLGMMKRPTTAGQAKFGDVDVNGSDDALSQEELEMAKRAAGY